MSKVQIIRVYCFLALAFYSLKSYSQVELKIEPSKYYHLDSAAVFYCQDDNLSQQVFRFDFDSFLFDEISWYYDFDNALFYYTTKTLRSTCSSSGNNEVKITFGCFLIQCLNDVEELIKTEIISNQKYPIFKDIVINGNELIFILNKQEVKRVSLAEVSKSQLSEFLK